jgi:hypothetical protein
VPEQALKIRFLEDHTLTEMSTRLVQGTIGLYFIFLQELRISYPFKSSRLVYIGMSESRQNSIGARLRDHRTGQSGNLAIMNYTRKHDTRFTLHTLEVLRILGTDNLFELESFFLADFLREHGAYPLCNNQSGVTFPNTTLSDRKVDVDWSHFA